MIVHVLPDTVYGNDFIDFLGEMHEPDRHYFYVSAGSGKTKILNNKSCQWEYLSKENIKRFKKRAKNADKLIVHGLFNELIIFWLFLNPWQLKKTIISIWGGDLYAHREIMEKENIKLSTRAVDIMKGCIFRKVPVFLNDMDGDFDLLKRWYHVSDAVSIPVLYPPSVDAKGLDALSDRKKEENIKSKVKILVGNSATETNFHKDIFQKLTKYKEQNIEIYCPLSYGNSSYANEVILNGEKIFGDKFHGITEFMQPEEYTRFLSDIDIAVFYNNRNQAMGNIALLAYLGCKIYIRNDTVMWSQYVTKGGCKFFSVTDIDKESFESFCKNEIENVKINQNYFKWQWDEKRLREMWGTIFRLQLEELKSTSII